MLEVRVAKLESDVSHIRETMSIMLVEVAQTRDHVSILQTDVAVIKTQLNSIDEKLANTATSEQLNAVRTATSDQLNAATSQLRAIISAESSKQIKWLVGTIALLPALYGFIAHFFLK